MSSEMKEVVYQTELHTMLRETRQHYEVDEVSIDDVAADQSVSMRVYWRALEWSSAC